MRAAPSVMSQAKATNARGTLPLSAFTMRGLLGVFWLCQGSSAARQAAVGDQEESVPLQLAWEHLAFSCAAVLVLVLVLALRRLGKKPVSGDTEETKQEKVSLNPEELESRLVYTFSQMEQEIVKLMTLVHKRKAGLTVHHRSCKVAECQQAKGSSRTFNLAVYDIVED